jgi:hypothetical protein
MIRTVTRAVVALLATLAIPAALFVAPLPASADSAIIDTPIHEANGHGWCIGSDTTDMFAPVVERSCPGRKWDIIPVGTQANQYELILHSDTSKCISAANNTHDVVFHPCDGGSGNVWIEEKTGGNTLWLNRLNNTYLTGPNKSQPGSQFELACRNCIRGTIQQFDPVP